VGKISSLRQTFCPAQPRLGRNRAQERGVGIPKGNAAAGWCGARSLLAQTHQHTGIHQSEWAGEGSGCLLSHLEQEEHSVNTQPARASTSSWDHNICITLVEKKCDLLHPVFNPSRKQLLGGSLT